jgi:5-dehydro-2-deoxygluconokinase
MAERRLDVITLGRSSVDLYGEQVGGRLEDMQSFAKYVGGCPTNIAIGTARLGLKSAVITRVGDEQMGRFIRETLAREGVDTAQVTTDPERLSALVILGIRDRHTFPHIFYRENCADMAIRPEHIDAQAIAAATALVVSGTHFSQPGVDAASRAAIGHAKAAGTKVVFDIDYRPVIWGLTGHAEGGARFLASETVSRHLQSIVGDCALVVGTEDEIHIAGGATDTLAALRTLRSLSDALLVLKLGPEGCALFPGAIPERLEDGLVCPGFPVEVFNTIGAGDGFMSGFLRGWVRDEPPQTCARFGNACGAIVVSRHGCSPASPTWAELQSFLAEPPRTPRLREDARLNHLHRVTTRRHDWPELCVLAFDHRRQLEAVADRHGVPRERIDRFKELVGQGARAGAPPGVPVGVIVDERYGRDVLDAFSDGDWWLARPVERPGSRPLAFEDGPTDELAIRAWPEEQVAKCLVAHHPDDEATLKQQQLAALRRLYEACLATRHELLIEVIPPKHPPADETTLPRALRDIYEAGVRPDWWKLPPPSAARAWRLVSEAIEAHDPHCRGVLLLGQEAPEAALRRSFAIAAGEPWCKGFAVGRSIFGPAAEAWFGGEIDDAAAVADVAARFRRLCALWRDRTAGVAP